MWLHYNIYTQFFFYKECEKILVSRFVIQCWSWRCRGKQSLLFFIKYFQGMSLFPSWWQYYCFHYFFSYLLLSMFIFSMLSDFLNIIFFCHYYNIIYLSYNSLFLLQPHRILIKDRTLSEIKANLIHSFLTVSFSSFILFIIIQMFYFLKILTLFEIFRDYNTFKKYPSRGISQN